MTKIDVISGFLGAGKTTFIKKLLSEALKDEKVVLIENEFGEIAIDGGFLKDSGIEIREMSQGCICCSLVGDFEKSLKEVISKFDPDRVIIEPSGVGKLSDVMKAVTDASASLNVVLNSAVTVVDAKKCKSYAKNFGEFFCNQIQYAGTVVLTRTDIADQTVIDEAAAYISSLNEKAEIITTPLAKLGGKRLLEIIEKRDDMLEEMRKEALREPDGESEEEHEHHHCGHHHHHEDDDDEDDDDNKDEHHHCGHHHEHEEEHHCCGHHHHDEEEHHHCGHHHDANDDEDEHEHHHCEHHHHHGHDADEVFESYGWQNVPAISKAKLEEVLKQLSEDEERIILRAKGMLKAADADTWYYFDMVPGEYEIREDAPDYTGKVCVIGSRLDEAELKKLFF